MKIIVIGVGCPEINFPLHMDCEVVCLGDDKEETGPTLNDLAEQMLQATKIEINDLKALINQEDPVLPSPIDWQARNLITRKVPEWKGRGPPEAAVL